MHDITQACAIGHPVLLFNLSAHLHASLQFSIKQVYLL